jgi:hypothetical protein
MSENIKGITTANPSSNSRWTAPSSVNGKTHMSYRENWGLTGMRYSAAAKANRKGHTGMYGSSRKIDKCLLNFSHTI